MYDSIYLQFDYMIKNNKLFHSYLFEVDNYDDNYQLILNFIKMILFNCESKYVLDNDRNEFEQIDENNYVDLRIIEPDGNEIKVDQMRSLLSEFNNTSLVSNRRVYLIKEADKFNDHSANAMLKFLEEPCDNVYAILLTKNKYNIIDTIISRCQYFSLKDINKDFFVDEELINGILNIKNVILNYDLFFNSYFIDKDVARNNLINVQKYLIEKLIDDKNINKYSDIVLVIENNIKKLKYNVNYKLWFDCLLAELLEVQL